MTLSADPTKTYSYLIKSKISRAFASRCWLLKVKKASGVQALRLSWLRAAAPRWLRARP